MILRILKSNRSVNYILFPLIGLLFWGNNLLYPNNFPFYEGESENILFLPVYKLLKDSLFLQSFFSLIFTIALAFIVQQINYRYSFIRIRTMLPASLFVIIVGGLTQIHTMHPVFFGALFLLLVIYRLFSMYDQTKPYSAAFDAGFLLGIGSLFYFNLILLFPAFLIGIAILTREYHWRTFVINVIGLFLPWFFAFGFAVLTEQFLEMLKILERNIITPNNHFLSNIPLQIFLGFLIILTLIGSIKLIQQYDTKKVSSRKYFTAFFLIFVFSMASYILVPATSFEILIITAIPVSYLVSNFFVFLKSRFWSELIFAILVGMVIFIEVMAF